MVKFLILRFSSIGDIVLTTPVIRGLKQQVDGAEVHYLTKPQFAGLLNNNPYVDKTWELKPDLNETIREINQEGFHYIIDLHHNLRTSIIKRKTGLIAFAFNKLNFKKWLLVNLKIDKMPEAHIVDRYYDTVSVFDVNNDGKGLGFYIPDHEEVDPKFMHAAFEGKYMVVVVGANHFTKQIPKEKLVPIINLAGIPVCLVGGQDVADTANEIEKQLKVPFLNSVAKLSINQSASIIKQSALVITPDTGMMHIAAAFHKKIFSFWGNTVPAFGMYPYQPGEGSQIVEINHLKCRPCSKIGHKKCPKGHFNCMMKIDEKAVVKAIQETI